MLINWTVFIAQCAHAHTQPEITEIVTLYHILKFEIVILKVNFIGRLYIYI